MITDVEYRAFYLIDGQEDTEVLHVANTGLLPFLAESGDSLAWQLEEYPEDDVAQAIMAMLSRAQCEGYSVDEYEEEEVEGGVVWYFEHYADDYWPIRSITFHQGWFAVLYEGPFEEYDDALARIGEVLGDDAVEVEDTVESEEEKSEDLEEASDSDDESEDDLGEVDWDDADDDADDDDDDDGDEPTDEEEEIEKESVENTH